MDATKINRLTSSNDHNMENNNNPTTTEISMSLLRREGPLAQHLANKLSIVANTNALM